MRKQTSAFTLIELLVVIAIIAILAGLAVPVVGGVMKSSQKASTLNQIKQISTLAVTYAADNNGLLPEEGGEGVQAFSRLRLMTNAWYNVLPELAGLPPARDYRGNPPDFYSAQSLFFVKAANYPERKTSRAYFAFGINSQLMDEEDGRARIRLHQITKPSRTALFAEAGLPDEKDLLPAGGATDDLGQPKVRDKRFVGRYSGSGIVGFADGHAEVVPVNLAHANSPSPVYWELP
jgi:prepilin-type N-terminal cleavage/methylation domain-containing protein/prepilin-type processing-associated H-X9-DG protein